LGTSLTDEVSNQKSHVNLLTNHMKLSKWNEHIMQLIWYSKFANQILWKTEKHHCRNNSKISSKNGKNNTCTPNTHLHDCLLSCLGTGTSLNSGGVKLHVPL
jgi:hypothetical protein